MKLKMLVCAVVMVVCGCSTSRPAYTAIDPKEFVSRLDQQNKAAAESAARLAEIKDIQTKQEASLQTINGSLQEIKTLLADSSESTKSVEQQIATLTAAQVQSDDLPDFVEEAFGWPADAKLHVWVDEGSESTRWKSEVGSKLESIGVDVQYLTDTKSEDAKRLNVAGSLPMIFISRGGKIHDGDRIRGFMSFDGILSIAKKELPVSSSMKVSQYSTGRRTGMVDWNTDPSREELIRHLREHGNHSGKSFHSQYDLDSMSIDELHALHYDDHHGGVRSTMQTGTVCVNGQCYQSSQPVQYSQPVQFFRTVRSSGRTVCSGGQCYRIDD